MMSSLLPEVNCPQIPQERSGNTHGQDARGLRDVFVLKRGGQSVWGGGTVRGEMEASEPGQWTRRRQDLDSRPRGGSQVIQDLLKVGAWDPSLTRDQMRIHSSLDTFSSISGCSIFTAVRKRMAVKLPVGQRHSEGGSSSLFPMKTRFALLPISPQLPLASAPSPSASHSCFWSLIHTVLRLPLSIHPSVWSAVMLSFPKASFP